MRANWGGLCLGREGDSVVALRFTPAFGRAEAQPCAPGWYGAGLQSLVGLEGAWCAEIGRGTQGVVIQQMSGPPAYWG